MPDNQVEEIKSKIDIVSFIGERLTLKKSGRNYKGLCPFHGEKTPSFFVSPDMQMYKCFGCGAAGDIYNFLMNYEGLIFPEALELLADRAGVVLTKRERTTSENERERILELIHLTTEYYHFLLTSHPLGEKARLYLKKRHTTKQTIEDFKIGYAPDSWNALQQYLIRKKGYTAEELEAAGLIIKRSSDQATQRSNGYYDRFRGRLMFPLTTYAGKIVGFSGRTLDAEAKEAKYINSPETNYYHKSELLFGVHLAKKAIREKNRIIIVEGEFDVLSSHQIGLKETVAIKGSALTDEQAALIRRLTHNVTLALDADAAGQEAIKRGIVVCEKQALDLRVVKITGGKDPDELAKADPAVWKEAVGNATSVYDYLIDSACEQYDPTTSEGKKYIARAVMPELAKIEHAIERESYIKKLAATLHVSETAVNEELTKAKRLTIAGNEASSAPVNKSVSRRELLERQLLSLALQSHQVQEIITDVNPDWFAEPHLKRLLEAIKTIPGKQVFGAALIDQLPEAMRALAGEIVTSEVALLEESVDNITSLLTETKQKLEQVWAKQYLVELSQQTELAASDEEKQALQLKMRRTADLLRQVEGGRN